MKTPVIYDPDPADPDKRVVNQEATLAAREKQKADQGEVPRLGLHRSRPHRAAGADLQRHLQQFAAPAVRRLAPRLPRHEPGDSRLRQHQKDAVWRGMSSGNTLLAHVVGAGKTDVMAATGMKMKQAGLIKKPMIVVPNHLLEQFAREFSRSTPTPSCWSPPRRTSPRSAASI